MRSALLPLCLVATAFAGCGGSDEPAQSTSPEPAATAAAEKTATGDGAVAIQGFKYLPEDATVEAGTKVEWTNEDDAPHTATADDGSFDTGNLREGDTGQVTFRKPGQYEYFCEFHKFMRGRITVG